MPATVMPLAPSEPRPGRIAWPPILAREADAALGFPKLIGPAKVCVAADTSDAAPSDASALPAEVAPVPPAETGTALIPLSAVPEPV